MRPTVLPRWLWALVLIGALAGALKAGKVLAVELNHAECQGLAVWSHDIPLMRDLGADKTKVRAYLESKRAISGVFSILLRNFENLWAFSDPLDTIMQPIYDDCVQRRGRYGTDA